VRLGLSGRSCCARPQGDPARVNELIDVLGKANSRSFSPAAA